MAQLFGNAFPGLFQLAFYHEAAVIQSLDWGWRMGYPHGTLTWLLEASASPHMGHSRGLPEHPHDRAVGFLQSRWSNMQSRSHISLWSSFESFLLSLPQHHGHAGQHLSIWNPAFPSQRYESSMWGSLRAPLDAGIHKWLSLIWFCRVVWRLWKIVLHS